MKKELTWEQKRAAAKRDADELTAIETKNRALAAAVVAPKKPAASPIVKPPRPSRLERLVTLGKGLAGDAADKVNSLIPDAQKKAQEQRKKVIDDTVDKAVEGKPSD